MFLFRLTLNSIRQPKRITQKNWVLSPLSRFKWIILVHAAPRLIVINFPAIRWMIVIPIEISVWLFASTGSKFRLGWKLWNPAFFLCSCSLPSRRITDLLVLTLHADQVSTVNINRLVVERSLQLLIGRNLANDCYIIYCGGNYVDISGDDARYLNDIQLFDQGNQSYVPYGLFTVI